MSSQELDLTRNRWGRHPNSLEARTGFTPELRKKISQGRKRLGEDARYFETWAKFGFVSNYEMDEI